MKTIFGLLIMPLLVSSWSTTRSGGPSTMSIKELLSGTESEIELTLGKTSKPQVGDCQCVPRYRCKDELKGNIRGVGLIDPRFPSTCLSYLDTCCKPADILSSEQKVTSEQPPVHKGCGKWNKIGVGYRLTGPTNETQFGEFPWVVAVLKDSGEYVCGGSLIHPSVVLTAAHCVKGKQASALKIRAGEWNTQSNDEVLPHQDRTVADYVFHEKYNAGSLKNDLALLKLANPVEIADNVDVICLPERDVNIEQKHCLVTSWGKDMYGKRGQYQGILKKVELPVVSHGSCQTILRSVRSQPDYELDRSFICAGGENGKDACKGDGGSPLMCPFRGQPDVLYQAGLVSWGVGCGQRNVPGVYANVVYGRSWIDEKMALWYFSTDEKS